jgi:cation diffusion facilitator family transporter
MPGPMATESRRTVLVALGANVAVAAVKFGAALVTGSSAMFAEGAHSVADTLNEVFLLTSLSRSGRAADSRHPFGYGMERFFWSLLAALGIVVAGAGFSGIEAYRAFTSHETIAAHYFVISYAALGLALAADGTSWIRALRQVRAEAKAAGRTLLAQVRASHDPSVKTVAGEDTAAVIGIGLAAGGIALHQATGAGWWEGVAAALIAVLLLAVGLLLAVDVKAQLIGEAADPQLRQGLCDYLVEQDAVDEVVDVLTMQIGVRRLLVAVRVDLSSQLSSDDVEKVSAELDAGIRDRWPQVHNVFLDATRSAERVRRVGLTG